MEGLALTLGCRLPRDGSAVGERGAASHSQAIAQAWQADGVMSQLEQRLAWGKGMGHGARAAAPSMG